MGEREGLAEMMRELARTFWWLWLGGRRPVVAAPWEQVARGSAVLWWWHAGEVERERPGLSASLG